MGRTVNATFSSRRRHTRLQGDWSSDVCSSDLDIQCWHTAGVSNGRSGAARGSSTAVNCGAGIRGGTLAGSTLGAEYDLAQALMPAASPLMGTFVVRQIG